MGRGQKEIQRPTSGAQPRADGRFPSADGAVGNGIFANPQPFGGRRNPWRRSSRRRSLKRRGPLRERTDGCDGGRFLRYFLDQASPEGFPVRAWTTALLATAPDFTRPLRVWVSSSRHNGRVAAEQCRCIRQGGH